MCEIEHFVDPDEKDHPKFVNVAEQTCIFFSACNQMDGVAPIRTTIGAAVQSVTTLLVTARHYGPL